MADNTPDESKLVTFFTSIPGLIVLGVIVVAAVAAIVVTTVEQL